MPEENFTPSKETDPALLKKRVAARAAMGGGAQEEVIPPAKKSISPPTILKETAAPIPPKKEPVFFTNQNSTLTPPAFKMPSKENSEAQVPSEIKKEKAPEPISIVPTNHQGAGLPKGEVLSEEIVAQKKRFIIGGIVFTLLGGLLIILAIVFFNKEPAIPVRPVPPPLVPDVTTVITEGANTEETKRLIWEGIDAISSPKDSLHILALYKNVDNTSLTGSSLFSALGFTLPTSLASSLNDALFGFTHNETRDGFFVLKIKKGNTFYEAAVSGMQAWEKDIAETIGVFMSKKEILENGVWTDDTLANIPVRIKEGREGSQIIYGFFNKETIIIAKTKEVFSTVNRRLRTPLSLGGN